ncbi:hypothetical protein [Streptomonospora litoralis]|uniref:DUF4352 domain-containing protein n=1 Tax=Streptomonospora litoralis TaxID=2498135 RepID=A0A4V0ZJ18_9ACTN|nr:hypothetical protein [Streptomonospora litoralis]QBI51932.1 hypothetical protein EKD16_00555 [Streptomonospora litoralis]
MLLLVLPIALGVPWWMERQDMLDQGAIRPEPTMVPASDEAAELVGTRWELRGVLVGELEGAAPPPEGTRLVDAVFKLTPGEGASRKRLVDCKFRAVDGEGRWWRPTSAYDTRPSLQGTPTLLYGCTDDNSDPLPAGEEVGAVVSFVVPEDAVDSLTVEVAVPTSGRVDAPAPASLRFEQK